MEDDRTEQTVRMDKWDLADYASVREEIAQVVSATDALKEITPTARAEMRDVYAAFSKAYSEFEAERNIRHDHLVDLAVNKALKDLPEYQELRRYTRGDMVGSAMAAVRLEPTLETLFDREKQKQEQADRLQELYNELLQKLSQLSQMQIKGKPKDGEDQGQGEGDDPADGEGSGPEGGGQSEQDLEAEIEALQDLIDNLEKALKEGLAQDGDSIRAALQGPLRDAADEARNESMQAQAWGLEPGQLQRLPADERLKLAARLDQPRLRKIAELWGPLHNIQIAVQTRRVPDIPHEVTGVTMGRDLERLLPSEIVKLRDPRQKRQFYVDYAEGKLSQYKVFGTERVGKGGIVFCEDGSGSMSGNREMMAKAFMLCLLNIAKVQRREFHLLHFGSPGQLKHLPFKSPAEYTMDNVVDAAELFFGGGPLAIGERVVTPSGWKTIGSVEVGDQVYGPDGKPRNVIGVYPQGVLKDVYRVTFKDGASVVCDATHLWTVLDRTANGVNASLGEWKTIRLSEIIESGVEAKHNGFRYSVPMTEPVEMAERQFPIDPYLLGQIIGNGGLTSTTPMIFSMPGDEVEWMKAVPSHLSVVNHEKREGFCPALAIVSRRGSGGGAVNSLTNSLRSLGLWGHGATSKFIPDEYLWGSIDQRRSLLQGLLDSDGTCDRPGRVSYSTASEKLAGQIVQLVQSLGAVATMRVRTPKKDHWSMMYEVNASLQGDWNPFRLARKAAQWMPRHHPYLRSIVEVEPLPDTECVCIKVDQEDGLFLTEGFVVTHNTDFQTPLKKALEILKEEHARTGRVQSDIVFMTDGQAGLTDTFIEQFHRDLDAIQGKIYGIIIDGPRNSKPLWDVCREHVVTVHDVLNGGKDLKSIFKALGN